MADEWAALAVLAKRSFDRSEADVELLAAWLIANCGPFFGPSMRQDVVQQLCSRVGHLSVDALQPIYTQGQVGDCMYVVVKGYCSVLKHAEASTSHAPAAAGASTSTSGTSSRHGTQSYPASRRATLEMQTQQFARATGAVGPSTGTATLPAQPGASRRGTVELGGPAGQLHAAGQAVLGSAGTAAGSSVAASRRVSMTVSGTVSGHTAGSRRVTAEQMVQQQLAESTQLGWLSRGDSFGEAALVNPTQQRPVSVIAGDEGCMLLVLDRACFNRLQQQAQEGDALAAAALQAVLAAACRPILRVGGRTRSAEEVETLAELFSGLEAFKSMPQPVRSRLAKACQGVHLPAEAVVFKEDDKGDAMYVVVSGSLQVRARPLQASAAEVQPLQEMPAQPLGSASGGGGSDAAAAHNGPGTQEGSIPGGAGARKMRATADAVCAGPSGSGDGSSGVCGQLKGSRRTTWEGAAFTAKEQGRLDAVRTALQAERLQEASTPVVQDKGSSKGQGSLVERDGLYWTAKFMADASSAATASDPHWGLEGGMTPLAAVFASKWRQQVREQAVQHHAQAAVAKEEEADSKAYAAMEEMLGKAAAKVWKAARDDAANLATAAAPHGSSSSSKPIGSNSTHSAQAPLAPLPAGADEATVAAATVVAGRSSSDTLRSSDDTSTPTSPSGTPTADLSASINAEGSNSQPPSPCTPRTAAAAAAQLLAAAAAATDPVEAVKLHLAALGVKDPADVSRTLMAEIGARANLEGLLQAVAEFLERKGLPRRLNKSSSLKITRELNKRMLAGASRKGFSGSQGSSFNNHTHSHNQHQQQQQQHSLTAGSPKSTRTRNPDAGSNALSGDGCLDGRTVTAEHTGLSSAGWQDSSMDVLSCDGAGMSHGALGQEDSMDSSMLDSVDLAASTGTGMGAASCQTGVYLGGSCRESERQQQQGQQREQQAVIQLPGGAAGRVGVGEAGCYTARYGPVIRTLGTGDSFGELALLQCSAVRTATVVVAPEAAAEGPDGSSSSSSSGSSSSGALLVKISRSCYDSTVRTLQVSALEELLGFLSSLPAFSGLSREALTSLSVFVKPLTAQPGQVLALASQPADALVIIQTGDVKLLCPSGASPGAEPPSPAFGRSGSFNGNGSNNTSAAVPRRTPGTQPQEQTAANGSGGTSTLLGRQLSRNTGSFNGSSVGTGGSSADGSGGWSGGGLGVRSQQQLSGVQLAVLGAGSLLGENVLGYNPEEDPVAAIAAAGSRRARQAAMAAAASLTHHATAVAASPCKLLLLHAEDLRRFGRRVRGPLAEAGVLRRDWLQQRIAAVQVPHASLKAAHASLMQPGGGAGGANSVGYTATSPPVHGMSGQAASGGLWQSAHTSGASRTSGTSGGNSSGSGSSSSSGALWPGLASLLAPVGSFSAAAAVKMQRSSPGAAAAAHRNQWQQQQWQQGAYGELLQEPQQQQQQRQQQQQGLGAGDVARLRQVVPGMQPPCVSELAAAARPFPAGMLSASSVAAAGRDGALKGLQLLLLSEEHHPPHSSTAGSHLRSGGDVACGVVGSPKWSVGPGGRVLPVAGAAAGATEGKAGQHAACVTTLSGRRAPMAAHLERDSEG